MKEVLLNDLIDLTKEFLSEKNHVSPGTLVNYEKDGFKPIRKYFGEHGFAHYSSNLIDGCIKSTWDEYQRGNRSLHQFQVFRKAANILREVYETGTLQWQQLLAWNTKELTVESSLVLSNYLVTINGTYSLSTVCSKKNIIRQFLFFLENDGIPELSKLSSKNILNYLEFISGCRPFSMSAVIPTIRLFISYLYAQGFICDAFASLLNVLGNSSRQASRISLKGSVL